MEFRMLDHRNSSFLKFFSIFPACAWVIRLVFLSVIASLLPGVPCFAAESQAKDILLVAPTRRTTTEIDTERQVVLALSASGYDMDYVREDQAKDYLSAYTDVIYFPGTDGSGIADQTGQTLVLGVMTDGMVRNLGLTASIVKPESDLVTYTSGSISEQGNSEQYLCVSGSDYQSGTIMTESSDDEAAIVYGIGRVRNIQMTDFSSMLAKSILIQQVNSFFSDLSSRQSASDYLVLTGSCQEETEKLSSVLSYLSSLNFRYVLGVLPEDPSDLSEDYKDLLLSAEQKNGTLALDLSQSDLSDVSTDKIEKIVQSYAKQKLYLMSVIVDSGQLSSDLADKLPSSLLIINGDSALREMPPVWIIRMEDRMEAAEKTISYPLNIYRDGSYHASSFSGNICIGLDLPEEALMQRLGNAVSSDIVFSSLKEDPKADLYSGEADVGTANVSYVKTGRNRTIADRVDHALSFPFVKAVTVSAFICFAFFVQKHRKE